MPCGTFAAVSRAPEDKPVRTAALVAFLAMLLPLNLALAAKQDDKPEYQGPTEADIRAAYATQLDWINDGSRRFLSEEAAAKLRIELIKLSFIECDGIEGYPKHYLCSVLVEASVGAAPAEIKRVELTLVKEDEVWKVQ